jgi:hypothetical protein
LSADFYNEDTDAEMKSLIVSDCSFFYATLQAQRTSSTLHNPVFMLHHQTAGGNQTIQAQYQLHQHLPRHQPDLPARATLVSRLSVPASPTLHPA